MQGYLITQCRDWSQTYTNGFVDIGASDFSYVYTLHLTENKKQST